MSNWLPAACCCFKHFSRVSSSTASFQLAFLGFPRVCGVKGYITPKVTAAVGLNWILSRESDTLSNALIDTVL